jgi:hypothetical protein
MKNRVRALLLVTIGALLLSPMAMAQDALSVVLPAPYTTRVGTQLMYFYEDGANLGARGSFQSFMTIVNTSITSGVYVHFQFYVASTSTCQELFDFVDYLTPGQRFIFDPKGVRRPSNFGGGAIVGTATDGRYILTATPIVNPATNDLQASSFNWLSGQIWVSDIGKSATWMTNAVSRLAVDAFGGPVPDGFVLQGATNGLWLQMFRPQILAVNSFFKTAGAGAVQPGVPFGNRLSVFTFIDSYFGVDPFYRITGGTVTLSSFVFDDQENAFSVPPRTAQCVTEWVIAPDVANASGNFADFLGPALTSAVASTGGWLRMRVSGFDTNESALGWFSQYLGTFGGGDYLIGIGRQGVSSLSITSGNGAASPSATIVTTSSTTNP